MEIKMAKLFDEYLEEVQTDRLIAEGKISDAADKVKEAGTELTKKLITVTKKIANFVERKVIKMALDKENISTENMKAISDEIKKIVDVAKIRRWKVSGKVRKPDINKVVKSAMAELKIDKIKQENYTKISNALKKEIMSEIK